MDSKLVPTPCAVFHKERDGVNKRKVEFGNIRDVSGEMTSAARDLAKGYTTEQMSLLIKQIKTTFQPDRLMEDAISGTRLVPIGIYLKSG